MLHTLLPTSARQLAATQSSSGIQSLATEVQGGTAQSQKRKDPPPDEIVVRIETDKKIRGEDIIELPICLDTKDQSKQRFARIIDQLVALGCQNIICILTAELQSINYRINGFSEQDAKTKALDDEKRWIAKHDAIAQKILKGKSIKFGIKHWNEVIQEKKYCEAKERISQKLNEKKYQDSFQRIVDVIAARKLSQIQKRQEGATPRKKKPSISLTDTNETVVKNFVGQYLLLEFPHIGSAIIQAFNQRSDQNKVFIAYALDNGPTITADEKEERQSLNIYIAQFLREMLLPSLTSTTISSVFLNIKFANLVFQIPRGEDKLKAKEVNVTSKVPALTGPSPVQSSSSAMLSTQTTKQISELTDKPLVQQKIIGASNNQKSALMCTITLKKLPPNAIVLHQLNSIQIKIQKLKDHYIEGIMLGENREKLDKAFEEIGPQVTQVDEQVTKIYEQTTSQYMPSLTPRSVLDESSCFPVPS